MIQSHSLIRSITKSELRAKPSPNIYFWGYCSDSEYKDLLEMLPPESMYKSIDHPDAMTPEGEVTRSLLDLSESTIARMDTGMATYWEKVLTELRRPELAAALFKQLNIEPCNYAMVPIFYNDKKGYRIGIHTDASYKIATMQLYFPSTDDLEDVGTEFYDQRDGKFVMISKNRFLKNSGYAFARTDRSWHAVSSVPEISETRRTLALTYYVPGFEYSSKDDYVSPENRT